MTLRVTIKNEDGPEDKVVEVTQVTLGGEQVPGTNRITLKLGQSTECTIYNGSSVLVAEKVATRF